MAIKEIMQNIPLTRTRKERQSRQSREQEIARAFYHEWFVNQAIDFPTMQMKLRQIARNEGLDVERIYAKISELSNPLRET